jgi:hypothetical protein
MQQIAGKARRFRETCNEAVPSGWAVLMQETNTNNFK